MTSRRKRYKVYRVDGDRSWLVDDFSAREAAVYVHKTVPNFLVHIRTFGHCEGNGHKAIPYEAAVA